MNDNFVRAALAFYEARGFSLIPLLPAEKRPAIAEWKTYQTRRSTEAEHRLWWPSGLPPEQRKNIGVVTGSVSGIVVLDLDDKETYDTFCHHAEKAGRGDILKTYVVQTGRGYHLYYEPNVSQVKTTSFKWNGKTHHLKAEGGYVVAPPSIHPNGGVYAGMFGLTQYPKAPRQLVLADLAAVLQSMGVQQGDPEARHDAEPGRWKELFENIGEGGRNDAASKLAGILSAAIYEEALTLDLMRCWNEARCHPPLPDGELAHLVSGLYQRYQNYRRRRQADHSA